MIRFQRQSCKDMTRYSPTLIKLNQSQAHQATQVKLKRYYFPLTAHH